MPVEMGIWRIDGYSPQRLAPQELPNEKMLEEYLCKDPSLLGMRLLVIGGRSGRRTGSTSTCSPSIPTATSTSSSSSGTEPPVTSWRRSSTTEHG